MNGVAIIEQQVLDRLFGTIESLEARVTEMYSELKESKKAWMSVEEACAYMGKGSTWVYAHKADIGFTKVGNDINFKRVDIDSYMEKFYYKR